MKRWVLVALVLAGCATGQAPEQPAALKCGGKIAVATLFAPIAIAAGIVDLALDVVAAPIVALMPEGKPFAHWRELGEMKPSEVDPCRETS